jgi:hypothetical protein
MSAVNGILDFSASNLANPKLAARFRGWADTLESQIEHAGRPMSQNPPPKRNREYQSRLHDARNMERAQKAFRVLADAHEDGSIPESLATLKTKDEIRLMVYKGVSGQGGYYSVIASDDFRDTSPAARLLQQMIDLPAPQRAERDRLRKIGTLQAEIQLSNIPGYFPTQSPVVDLILQRARIEPGMTVLEPEAGSGHIADAVKEECPGAVISVCEINLRLRELLKLKGYTFAGEDFMELEQGSYDRIVMNPPFEKQADIDHIQKAYSLLAPEGILVSVLSPSFEFRSDRKSVEFRGWLDSLDATWENLPDGSFKASGTGIATRLVVIEK